MSGRVLAGVARSIISKPVFSRPIGCFVFQPLGPAVFAHGPIFSGSSQGRNFHSNAVQKSFIKNEEFPSGLAAKILFYPSFSAGLLSGMFISIFTTFGVLFEGPQCILEFTLPSLLRTTVPCLSITALSMALSEAHERKVKINNLKELQVLALNPSIRSEYIFQKFMATAPDLSFITPNGISCFSIAMDARREVLLEKLLNEVPDNSITNLSITGSMIQLLFAYQRPELARLMRSKSGFISDHPNKPSQTAIILAKTIKDSAPQLKEKDATPRL